VLINLLGNAVKFTDRGRVKFKVEQLQVKQLEAEQLEAEQLDQTLPNAETEQTSPSPVPIRFHISDTGIGMSPKTLEKIFQPFEQASDSKRNAEGTGLGLAISQTILQLMDSQIQVESELGVGSTFRFDVMLPIATEWDQAITQEAQIVGYQGERQTILMVDDKWENRSVIVNLLEPLGFTVVEAEEGQAALTQALQIRPNLIITDMVMPGMDGYELLQQIRQSEELKQLPVIVSSASISPLDQQYSLDAGGNDFLVKPIQTYNLFQMLSKHLNLTWIYQKTVLEPESIPSIEANIAWPPPPSETLLELLHFAKQGRLKKLAEIAKDLEQQDSQYSPLVQHLLQLCKGFQVEKLEALLQQLTDQVTNGNEPTGTSQRERTNGNEPMGGEPCKTVS
jgi:CheY-like chemotaxis protein